MPNFIVMSAQAGTSNMWSEDDGATWTACTGITGKVVRFRHANGIWMAVTPTKIWSSTDGKSWADVTPGGAATFMDIDFGNGNWIAVGGVDFISGNNGASWSSITRPAGAVWVGGAESVVYGLASWVIGGNDTSGTHPVLIRSTDDGATWATVSIPGSVMEDISALAYGDGIMVGWGTPYTAANGYSTYSFDDGATWSHPAGSAIDGFAAGRIAFGTGRAVVARATNEENQSQNGTLVGAYIPSAMGTLAGDLMFAVTVADSVVTVAYNDFTGTQPWTLLRDVVEGTARFGLWTRTATTDDERTVGSAGAWIASGTSHSLAASIVGYRNAVLIDQQSQTATSSTPTAPAATGPASGTGTLICFYAEQIGATSTLTLDGALTGIVVPTDATGGAFTDVDTEVNCGAEDIGPGVTAPVAASSSGGSGPNIGWAITLAAPADTFLFAGRPGRFGPSAPQGVSANGTLWQRFAMSGVTSPFWRDVCYDGARFIVAGSGTVGGSPTPLVISTDLSTWTPTTSPFAGVDANAVGALAAATGGWSVGSIRIA